VLKGPQALFYGKNSPAGVIRFAVRIDDQTEAIVAAGYETVAQES